MIRVLILVSLLAAVGEDAAAQSRTATGAITVERALTISTVRPLSFGPSPIDGPAVASTGATQAIIEVAGDPDRTYRVRLPAMIATPTPGETIDGFTIWSENSGDISRTLTARMDATGNDRLHIGGSLRRSGSVILTNVTTVLPLSVDYE